VVMTTDCYFAVVESATGRLVALRMVPLRIHRMRLDRATPAEAEWLRDRLSRICGGFGSRVEMAADRRLWLRWPASESCDSWRSSTRWDVTQ
jgi:poly-gamma-glutamate capsule biosynthesis protein CapA/YwtB (metallophosphatase superfamily)